MVKHFTTSVFIVSKKEGEWFILLIHHRKFDRWMVPGGHVENFENPVTCAIREVKEETGLKIRLFSFIHKKLYATDAEWLLPPEYFYEQIIPAGSKEAEHVHLDFAYISFCDNMAFVKNDAETKNIEWFSIEKANALNLFDGTEKIIADLKEKLDQNLITYETS